MIKLLKERPLLLRACDAGAFGKTECMQKDKVSYALFTFLEGDAQSELPDRISLSGRHLVCLSEAWAQHLEGLKLRTYRRWHMAPQKEYHLPFAAELPEGCVLQPFDEAAFEAKPFSHGSLYADYADFSARGAGYVVRCGEKIVASASSVLSFEREAEMDISTDEAYRRKGLACACAAAMLKDCMRRGITVHWDAQNEASLNLALKLGYRVGCEYDVFLG